MKKPNRPASTSEITPRVIADALAGDGSALRTFVAAMTPVIHAHVVRRLLRQHTQAGGRDIRQEVEDMIQDVLGALFAHEGRALRAWNPSRGLSLANFVGLIADRQVASILRSARRNPWQDAAHELHQIEAEVDQVPCAEPQIESRATLELLLDRLRASLSPRGLELFQRLYVDEEPIEDVAPTMGMTRDAIYAWRNRVGKLLRTFASELDIDPSSDLAASRRTQSGTHDHGG